ncbi:hypothetical protein JMJ35_001245 [Cladonia borealis]|uniref:Uncharacterized protein n=1 Tax=Cladonia borealis TaxID=184061 RepID=A0AA39V597_9LECA|nr:hypothetical protein JMJ35_001245 [Cladonia borealis]
MVRILVHSVNPSIIWARLNRNRDPLTPDPHFRRDLEELLRPPQRPAGPPHQNIASGIQTQPAQQSTQPAQQSIQPAQQSIQPVQQSTQPTQQSTQPTQQSTQPTQQSTNIAQGNNINWVNCHLLPAGAQQGCPRVYWLDSVNRRTLYNHISIPDIAVTALYWGHVDALHKFLDMTRPRVYFAFHSWVGNPQLSFRDWQFCIKREGIEVTVGFLRKDTVHDWIVGCVYVFFGAKTAWEPKGSVDKDVPMEQSIAIVKEVLGPVPAYMCFVFEP